MRRVWVLQGMLWVALSACAAATAEPAPATEAPPVEGTTVEPTTVAQDPPQPATGAPSTTAGELVFQIQPSQSQARFIIGEILAGQPNTVIGVNDQLQGQVSLNPADAVGSRIGAIQVAAGAFVTDSNLRNRAINQFILETGAYPTISFVPTAIQGLPVAAAVGETVNLQILGDLTIRDITQPVAFQAVVTLAAPDRLEGSATATIQRGDFELTIPQVPRVAGVDEAVILELDFVALAQ